MSAFLGFLKMGAAEFSTLPQRLRASLRELGNLRSLTGGAMLAALNVILNQFTVFFSQFLHLSFTFLAVGVSGMLYGPMLTGSIGAIVDILKFFTHNDGSGFFPGFTISEFVTGFLYGLILYKRPVTLGRVFAARLSVTLVVNLFLTPLWLSMMYGQAFIALVSMRIVKNLILLPIETALLYFVLKKVAEVRLYRPT